jgi:sortase A
MNEHRTLTRWLIAERAAWAVAVICLVGWGTVYLAGVAGARSELERFSALQAAQSLQGTSALREASPDQDLWSPERIRAWQEALTEPAPAPLAVLRIPRIRLEVAVLEGTDEFVLNRAVGHIAGTAVPGADGNSGIAGHRDGFFRGLKDIAAGDVVEIETLHGKEEYRIERTWIVSPEEVSVLDPTPNRSLTLVTCYPFYFVGSAPRRFIVRAVHADGLAADAARRR